MTTNFKLPVLSPTKKTKMLRYARRILQAQHTIMVERQKNILHYTLQDQEQHVSMAHYPKGDRIDHQTGAQYFYHCHRENFDSMEHGHFHCFLRDKGIPERIKPTPLPDWDKNMNNPMTHIVAIALNCYGQPIRLFTVNRWVSQEVWYDARHVPGFVSRYKMTLKDPYWQILDQWVEGMLHLFAPQIAWLHQQRDNILEQYKKTHPGQNAYESHDLEEVSQIAIDLQAQIQWLLESDMEPVARHDKPQSAHFP
ncbi:DUF6969 family protein [Legionella spiritensis]|uniref:DUF6969 domain-containing protein n=1 Tax=Legionella spiritensis TaxID=452 RepID=A0A0W0YWD8_LEGSP|nr:hypothetical protein [Legionella spiritensis]KTD61237.1 hypothetical protein Lspi_2857 [Legionella spiritensis]SNV23691.1 Uncharacterised protein [Legionella spiritensis]